MSRIILCLFLLISSPLVALADGVPTSIEITPANISKLGFSLVATLDGPRTMVRFHFPRFMHETWPVQRVQAFLFDSNGKQLAVTSADYQVKSDYPVLLTEFNHQANRLGITIQYFCENKNGSPCEGAEAYEIESVTDYLIKSQTASNGTADGNHQDKPHP